MRSLRPPTGARSFMSGVSLWASPTELAAVTAGFQVNSLQLAMGPACLKRLH